MSAPAQHPLQPFGDGGRTVRGGNTTATIITCRPTHARVTLRPRPDLHNALHNVQVEGGSIMTELFGQVRVGSPVQYLITGKRNQFAFAEVVRVGEGQPDGEGQDRPEVAPGDIVGLDLGQVGHLLPDCNYLMAWEDLLCKFVPGRELPQPLMNWVLTEHDWEVESRFAFQRARLYTPQMKGAGGVKTNNRKHSQVRLLAEKVLATGPGRYVANTFVTPNCGVGDVALFREAGCVQLMWRRGQQLRFVRWRHVEAVLEGFSRTIPEAEICPAG